MNSRSPVPPVQAQHLISSKNLLHVSGPLENQATGISTPEKPTPGSLIFASSAAQLSAAIQAKPSIIIGKKSLEAAAVPEEICYFETADIPKCMSEVLLHFQDLTEIRSLGVSPTASVHPTAKIGQNVKLGHFCVVGAEATIGDNSVISHHTVVEAKAQVGAGCFLHPHVVIGTRCQLGDRVEIHSYTNIGSDGFGFAMDQQGHPLKIPQIGIVVIENDVELGSHCAIDRATLTETRICKHSKFDNFVHIAHNCTVGPNARIAAGFFLAGSSQIGANFMCGGTCQVADHVSITDNVVLGGRSGVSKDILKPGVYAGYPLEPLKDNLRNTANFTKLTELRRQVAELRRKVGLA